MPDATSVAAFVTLCTYTWFLYGVGPSLPLFRDELGTSSAVAGLHSLMLAAGIVLAGFTRGQPRPPLAAVRGGPSRGRRC